MIATAPVRKGTVIPLLAICSVALFGFVALAIDLGMLIVARSECQNAADAAALAGARVLDNRYPSQSDPDTYDNRRLEAEANARAVVVANQFLNQKFTFVRVTRARAGLYDYQPEGEKFRSIFPDSKPSGKSWTAMEVVVDGEQPAYFAHVLGISSLPTSARAVAAHRPRDIALVIDLSGSMQFSSVMHWEPGTAGSNDVVHGSLNPDPDYPRFGHYSRYANYQITSPVKSLVTNSNPSSRPNPLRMIGAFIGATGEVFAPNNHTIETPGGPPLVRDFLFNPIGGSVTSRDFLKNAFHLWEPPIVSPGHPASLTPPTYNWNGYDANDETNQSGSVPAPPGFAEQSNTQAQYVGDRSPRKRGVIDPSGTNWDPSNTNGAARHAIDLLFTNSNVTPQPRTIPNSRSAIANGNRTEGGTDWSNFYDDGWERNGYDLDLPSYIANNYSYQTLRSSNPTQGYSMGPGYWGKTFFIWPPDPRWGGGAGAVRPDQPSSQQPIRDVNNNWIADWRRRFFLRGNGPDTGSAAGYLHFDPQIDNDANASGVQNINQALLRTGPGHVLRDAVVAGQRTYRINYRAVLAWLKSGPQVLPPNLRAGRILYYSSIPDHVDDYATDDDQKFWRNYIDFVLGYTGNISSYDARYSLAGVESIPWPEGSAIQIGPTTNYDPDDSSPLPANPKPWMNLSDNPNRPRMHFWFGPATMLGFITTRVPNRNWLPGNSHEAQNWQLKAGLQSAIEDIKNNHPNDYVGLVAFGYPHYTVPRVAVGQNWRKLQNALFFPRSLLDEMTTREDLELRPYNAGFGPALTGNLPNANGQTDPNTGLALAFNALRGPNVGGNGRRGAAKFVIFESDGVPNAFQGFSISGAGANSSYYYDGTGAVRSNGHPEVTQRAFDVANQFRLLVDEGGHSLPSHPARIYPIAFGDLFSSQSPFRASALQFLSTLAYLGQTSGGPSAPLPTSQIITGSYSERIANIRNTYERILQSGVQVTLVE